MKKLVVFASFLIGFAGTVQAQEIAKPAVQEQVPVSGAIITFQDSKYDFGQIRQGDVVEHTFKFENTGTQPLIVSNVFTTCGCTVSDWTKTPVLPGRSGIVRASFNSAGKMGMQHKVLTIESNSMNGNANVSILTEIVHKDAEVLIQPSPAPVPVIETLATPEKKTLESTKPSKKAPAKKKKRSGR